MQLAKFGDEDADIMVLVDDPSPSDNSDVAPSASGGPDSAHTLIDGSPCAADGPQFLFVGQVATYACWSFNGTWRQDVGDDRVGQKLLFESMPGDPDWDNYYNNDTRQQLDEYLRSK